MRLVNVPPGFGPWPFVPSKSGSERHLTFIGATVWKRRCDTITVITLGSERGPWKDRRIKWRRR